MTINPEEFETLFYASTTTDDHALVLIGKTTVLQH
jgi:hypothetical protein